MSSSRGPREPWRDRFWRQVDKSDPIGCWLWTGYRNVRGYGDFRVYQVGMRKAHRISYEEAYGPIDAKLFVDHMCHNGSCVNPEHLRAVTPKQNTENIAPGRVASSTGFRGVTFRKESGRFRARVRHNNVLHTFGHFSTAEEAAEAARIGRLKLFTHSDGR